MKPYSVVVMAGQNEDEKAQFAKALQDYGTQVLPGYKLFHEFDTSTGRRSLYQFTLDMVAALEQQGLVRDVVIIGPRVLEERLGTWLSPQHTFVEQGASRGEYARQFSLTVDPSSFLDNAIEAYAHTEAYAERKHALFMMADTPLTTCAPVQNFLRIAEQYVSDAGFIIPFVDMPDMPGGRDRLGRRFHYYLNDTPFRFEGRKKHWTGAEALFWSSSGLMNPFMADHLDVIENIYRLRRILSRRVQREIVYDLRQYKLYDGIWKFMKYLSGTLHVSEGEQFFSKVIGGKVVAILISNEETAYDVDDDHDIAPMQQLIREKHI